MITLIVILYFSASLVSSLLFLAACMQSGRCQGRVGEEPMLISVEVLQPIAELDLPKQSHRRIPVSAHAGISFVR
jgi:hypothetical protein